LSSIAVCLMSQKVVNWKSSIICDFVADIWAVLELLRTFRSVFNLKSSISVIRMKSCNNARFESQDYLAFILNVLWQTSVFYYWRNNYVE
jgi:hypothetical protein